MAAAVAVVAVVLEPDQQQPLSAVACQLVSVADSDCAVATDPFASAILDIVSDQDDSDAEPATVHTAAATQHTSPDTVSVLLRSVVLPCFHPLPCYQ